MEERKEWLAKHTQPMFAYAAECRACDAKWEFESAVMNPELYCPLCDHDEPIKVLPSIPKEVVNG